MRRHHRHKRIVMPPGQSDHNQNQNRKQNEKFKHGGELSYHLNAAHVDVGDHRDDGERDDPVSPTGESGEIEPQVIGELNGVDAAQQE